MAAPLELHDTFTEDGLWWIAGQESDQVGGTLTYDPADGPKLKLLGMLRDVVASLNSIDEKATVYGITKRGKRVTLLRAMRSDRHLNLPGIAHETWQSNLLIMGVHLESDDLDIFSKSYIRFAEIEKWLGHQPFNILHDTEEKSLTVVARKPREVPFATHNEFEVSSVGSLYSSNAPDTRYTIDVISHLGITPSQPKSLNWHLAKAVRMQQLAALCTGHYLPLTSLELRGPGESLGSDLRSSEVHVYARMIHPERGSRPKHEGPMLTGPELIAFNPQAVQRWFDQYEVFRPAIDLFFTVASQRQMFTNVRLILAIQALEVFHRRTSAEAIMKPDDFNAFVYRLIEAIPSTANQRMKDKLKASYLFLNEPNLSQRLKSIVAELSMAFGTSLPAFKKAYLRKLAGC